MSKFEVVRGVEGCCLVLDDLRIAGPKPWGGGTVIHAWETDKEYKAIDTRSRWFELFGTPEKAMQTVFGIVYSEAQSCDGDCPLFEFCDAHADDEPPYDGGKAALLEWLGGDAE